MITKQVQKGYFLSTANLIVQAQTFDWGLSVKGNSMLDNDNSLAERVGFEPTLPFRVNLISSQAPSAELGHLSKLCDSFLFSQRTKKIPQNSSTLFCQDSSRGRDLVVKSPIIAEAIERYNSACFRI